MNNRIAGWLYDKKIAHRGLHNAEYAENSMSAFRHAIENNYNIEIDVQLNKDGDVVVFHDSSLKRVCGLDKKISEISTPELKDCKLSGTEDSIPLLTELLEVAEGRTGLLIEIKTFRLDNKLSAKLYDVIKDYKGDFAIQSFNPVAVGWYTKNAPHIYRGQLASSAEKLSDKIILHSLTALRFLKYNKPDFVAYDIRYIPNKYIERARKYGARIIAWTVVTPDHKDKSAKYCDNIIFEEIE